MELWLSLLFLFLIGPNLHSYNLLLPPHPPPGILDSRPRRGAWQPHWEIGFAQSLWDVAVLGTGISRDQGKACRVGPSERWRIWNVPANSLPGRATHKGFWAPFLGCPLEPPCHIQGPLCQICKLLQFLPKVTYKRKSNHHSSNVSVSRILVCWNFDFSPLSSLAKEEVPHVP